MNWMGGRLSRHSGAASSASSRQKGHYARAQQSLCRHSKVKSPVKWTIFNRIVEEGTGNHWEAKMITQSEKVDSREGSQSIHRQRATPSSGRPPTRKGSISRPFQSVDSQSRIHPTAHIKKKRNSSQDDIYDTIPPPRDAKRKRDDRPEEEDDDVSHKIRKLTASERRRKLLRKGDWTGVGMMEPLQISFPPPRRDDNVGRRRRITDDHRPRFESRQTHINSPFTKRDRTNLIHSSQGDNQMLASGKSDVRISIGGRVVPPGASSSTRRSRAGCTSRVPSSIRYQASVSSDFMLLEEDLSPPGLSTRINLASGLKNPVHIGSSDSSRRSLSVSLHGQQSNYRSWENQEGTGSCVTGRLDFGENISLVRERSRHGLSGVSRCSKQSKEALPPMSAIKCHAENGEPLFSSSLATIQHPAPQSSKPFALLRSSSSEIAESTVAQVGKMKPIVSSFQILNNEIWQTWMAPHYDNDDVDDAGQHCEEHNRQVRRGAIIPGVSATSLVRHSRRANISHTDGISEFETPVSIQSEDETRQTPESAALRPGQEESEHSEYNSDDHINVTREESARKPLATKKYPLKATALFQPATLIKSIPVPLRKSPDEIWRKFVFGSEEDGNQQATTFPGQHSSVHNRREETSDTSTLAQSSMDRFAASSQHNGLEQDVGGSDDCLSSTPAVLSRYLEAKYSKSHGFAVPINDSSGEDDCDSIRALKGTVVASSSDSPGASMVVGLRARSSDFLPRSATPSHLAKKKMLLTKPKPFVGQNSCSIEIF